MVSILPQGQDPIQSGLAGLAPALFQQLAGQNQQQQQQQLMSLLGGGALGGLLGGGGGGNQLDQLLKIAQDAGLEDTDEFKSLLMDSGLFGQGDAAPQSLLQTLFGGGLRNIQALGGLASGGLQDFIVNRLPGSVI